MTVNRNLSYGIWEMEYYMYFLKLIDTQLLKWLEEANTDELELSGEKDLRCSEDIKLLRTASHEAGHVIAHWFTKSPRKVRLATIIPGKGARGRVSLEKIDRALGDTTENVSIVSFIVFFRNSIYS